MDFLNRGAGLQRLDRALWPGALVAIRGRRRVGKSRLLTQWSRRRDGLYTVADQSSPPVQRRYMAVAAAQRFAGFGRCGVPRLAGVLPATGRRSRASAVAWAVHHRRTALPDRRGPDVRRHAPELGGQPGVAAMRRGVRFQPADDARRAGAGHGRPFRGRDAACSSATPSGPIASTREAAPRGRVCRGWQVPMTTRSCTPGSCRKPWRRRMRRAACVSLTRRR